MKELYFKNSFIRFLFVGIFNVIFSYLIYLIALFIIKIYIFAYTISFIISVIVSYLLNSKVVFNVRLSKKNMLKFPIVYIVQFIFGFFGLTYIVEYLNIDSRFAPIMLLIVTIPLTYILSKIILTKGSQA